MKWELSIFKTILDLLQIDFLFLIYYFFLNKTMFFVINCFYRGDFINNVVIIQSYICKLIICLKPKQIYKFCINKNLCLQYLTCFLVFAQLFWNVIQMLFMKAWQVALCKQNKICKNVILILNNHRIKINSYFI